MAQQSSFLKTIFSTPGYSIMGATMGGSNEQVVVDPWNNKYYGDQNKDIFLRYYDSQIKSIQETLARGYTETKVNNAYMGWGLNQTQRTKLDDAGRLQLTTQIEDLTKQRQDFDQNYVKQDRFFESYNAYQGDWNKYFEASYRNPRMEAEQKSNAIEKIDQFRAQQEEAANKAQLVSANQLEVQAPRQVGTGVGASRDTQINQLVNNGGTGLGL